MKLHVDYIFKALCIAAPTAVIIQNHMYNVAGAALLCFPYLVIFIMANKKQRSSNPLLYLNLLVLVTLLWLSLAMAQVPLSNAQGGIVIGVLAVVQCLIAWGYFVLSYTLEAVREYRLKSTESRLSQRHKKAS